LIDFLVLRRESTEASDLWVDYDPLVAGGSPGDKFTTIGGPDGLRPWEVGAAKDVVHLGHSQDVWVLTLWGPHDGDFMFHCHNLVHEDNVSLLRMYQFDHALRGCVTHDGIVSCLSFQDMMVAAGVGRKSIVDGTTYFDNGERQEVFLDTEDQDHKYYDTTGPQTPMNKWQHTGVLGGDGGSPYSPQTDGEINRNARSGMGYRAREIVNDLSWNARAGALDSTYVCKEICKGFYEVFYPDPTTSSDQLAYRPGYPETSDNPIRKNIWAVPYNAFSSAASDDFLMVDSAYTAADSTHNCTCVPPAAS